VNRKIKFQNGGRATPYNPVGHLTNSEETERQRIAGNKAARERTPVDKKGKYWWSEYTDPFTKPVDKFLSGALGPAAKPVQGLLSLGTPAESINEVLNKPTAENMITAATDTALTAAGLKTLGAPAAKVAQNVNRTTPGGKDMGKYKVAESIYNKAKKALQGSTGKKIKEDAKPRPVSKTELNNIKITDSKGKNIPPRNPNVKVDAKPRPVSKTELNNIKIKDSKGNKIKSPKGGPSTLVQTLKNNRGKIGVGTGVAAGTLLTSDEKAKKAKKAKKASGGSSQNPRTGYRQSQSKGANEELDISPGGKTKKASKQPDDGYKFYGKEGTGLGDFSRKYGMQYATPEQFEKDFNMDDGEKAGGRPGRGKMKTQGMNKKGKRKAGFSGRGSGAALRGF